MKLSPSTNIITTWKSYNCYNAAIGSILNTERYSNLYVSLNGNWDFYFNHLNKNNINIAGVYEKTEHPSVKHNLKKVYGLRVHYCQMKDWVSCRSLIRDLRDNGYFPLLCVLNTRCPFIPRSGRVIPLGHYLVCTGYEKKYFGLFDSFSDVHVSCTEEELDNLMQEVPEGDVLYNYRLRYLVNDDSPGTNYGITEIHEFFFKHLSPVDFMINKDQVVCGNKGILELSRYLKQLYEGELKTCLTNLTESLRYVQYQRLHFISALLEISKGEPQEHNITNELVQSIQEISDEWFKLRIKMLYDLKRGAMDLGKSASENLKYLYQLETDATQRIQQYKDRLFE